MYPVEQEIMEHVKRFPFNPLAFYSRLLVKKQRKMTEYELAEGIKRLEQRGLIYEPRPGYYEGTAHRGISIVERGGEGKMRAIHQVKKKQKILKSKVKLIKRRRIQGYECKACGKWIKRSWEKRPLSKCPKCGRKSYYGKPVFKEVEHFTEKPTKFMKVLFQRVEKRLGGPIIRQRVHKHRLTATRMFAAPQEERPREEAIIVRPKAKHMKQEEYRGSQEARDAARQAWDTRRARGWLGKAEAVQIFRALELRHERRNERRIIAFRKDKRTGKTHPITVRTSYGVLEIIPRRNGLMFVRKNRRLSRQ
jgi:rRNA maturation endonuclease Nob1